MPSPIALFVFFSTFLFSPSTLAQSMPPPLPSRIDVHSHFLPPFYREALAQNGHAHPDGMPAIPEWSLEAHVNMMHTANVSKAMLSISSPGTHLVAGNDVLARDITRQCNAYASSIKRQHPEKFGYWAALPLPDVDATMQEIETSVKEGAAGFGLMTNYHGNYLGTAAFDIVFDKLNELHATVFIHPTTPCIKHGNETSSSQTADATPFGTQYPVPVFEFFFDTARAVVNLFSSGTVGRCPNVTFIIPHAGGALPPVMTRFILFSSVVPGGRKLEPEVVRRQLETQFFFDLAGFVFDGQDGGSGQLKAFVEGFNISHARLLYGSDFPFTQAPFVSMFATRMQNGLEDLFNEQQVSDIYEGNAKALLSEGLKTNLKRSNEASIEKMIF